MREIKSLTDFQDFHQSARGMLQTLFRSQSTLHSLNPERYGWKVFGNFMLIRDSKKLKRGGRR